MSDTATKILDTAQELAQTKGFNAFSYADIANKIGIKKASVHYHFPTKANLGEEMILRYGDRFNELLEMISLEKSDSFEKLQSYAKLYEGTLLDDRMCLCGMMASDSSTLPVEIQDSLEKFFDDNEKWLSEVLEEGRKTKVLDFHGKKEEQAQFLLSSLQGALLVSRAMKSKKRFNSITNELLNTLKIRE